MVKALEKAKRAEQSSREIRAHLRKSGSGSALLSHGRPLADAVFCRRWSTRSLISRSRKTKSFAGGFPVEALSPSFAGKHAQIASHHLGGRGPTT